MPLNPGTRVGPYEITGTLGSGGMGEVFRAKDERLAREVAIKVLPVSFAADAERLQRFQIEARAAGQLNHPNVLTVYELGTHEGAPYLVTELLEGETLRERLKSSALPVRKALELGVQIARGLGAAHDKGIVHRDLKPENLFVTRDGRVKVLDFGLARIAAPAVGSDSSAETGLQPTSPGTVLGTVGYMSPEQVRGLPTDHRTDIFSFGAVLYEMLTGRRAFHGDSQVETMNAILKEDPPEFAEINPQLPASLDRIVRRCLEKRPDERFYSAHDLGIAIEALSGSSTASSSHGLQPVAAAAPRLSAGMRRLVMGAALVAIGAAAFVAGRQAAAPPVSTAPEYQRLTFRRGAVLSSRLAPDGHTVVYSAAWDSETPQLYTTRLESPESLPLTFGAADIAAISNQGELALIANRRNIRGWARVGTLARASLSGGASRALLEDVQAADWLPDGSNLVVSRFVDGRYRLEFPIGTAVYETNGWIGDPRVSPDGQRVAFLDHPIFGDDRGAVMVVGRTGKPQKLSGDYESTQGVAWVRSGQEIWFTGAAHGTRRELNAVSLAGQVREVSSVPGNLILGDIGTDGRVLLAQHNARLGMVGRLPGDAEPHDLSWFDWSQASDLSPDGKLLLIGEQGDGGGPGYSTYMRKTDGSPAVRLGSGEPQALSPDGRWVLTQRLSPVPAQLVLLPTGAGESRIVTNDDITHLGGEFLPDGKHIVFSGFAPGQRPRTYVQDLAGGPPRAITPEGIVATLPSPDGAQLFGRDDKGARLFCPTSGGECRPIPGLDQSAVVRWTADGKGLFLREGNGLTEPVRIMRFDLATGQKTFVRDIPPVKEAGSLSGVGNILLTPDARGYIAGYSVTLSDLYLVKGLQ